MSGFGRVRDFAASRLLRPIELVEIRGSVPVADVSESLVPLVPTGPTYVPKHRSPAPRPFPGRWLGLSGAAFAVTGLAVASGIVLTGEPSPSAASAALPATRPVVDRAAVLADRGPALSRSVKRAAVDRVKARSLSQEPGGQVTATEDLTTGDPRDVARAMLATHGFGQDQFSCLDSLYTRESGWNVHADNPTSSAYGIPQALPGSKMSSAGSDWADNPATQIEWGLGYIKNRYGSPCAAWSHSEANNWY